MAGIGHVEGQMGKATAYAVSGRVLWARRGALPVDGGDGTGA